YPSCPGKADLVGRVTRNPPFASSGLATEGFERSWNTTRAYAPLRCQAQRD
ncbi:hypothetical protein JG688_00012813, partial [Phytophthora aleatoria]